MVKACGTFDMGQYDCNVENQIFDSRLPTFQQHHFRRNTGHVILADHGSEEILCMLSTKDLISVRRNGDKFLLPL